ncbi:MAG: hypothetical protein IK076_08995, partial [Bacteroidales bacterium]|nr:hypothetical protein [Bacteroidales bacterium]
VGVHVPVTEHIKETEHTQSHDALTEKEDHEKETVYIEVEKPWKWYDKAALRFGQICFVSLILALIIWAIFLYLKRKF